MHKRKETFPSIDRQVVYNRHSKEKKTECSRYILANQLFLEFTNAQAKGNLGNISINGPTNLLLIVIRVPVILIKKPKVPVHDILVNGNI